MNRILAFVFALCLAACQAAAPEPPLAGADIGGPFRLVDSHGKTVTDTDLKGRYALLYFGYTFCPDVCPTDLARLSAGLKAFERQDADRGARVQPVFVSVDPERDTPTVVGQFIANFHPRLIGLTGTPEAVAAMLKTYRVYARKAGDGPDYLVDHSANAYLFDPDGKPLILVGHDEDAAAIAADLDKWVK